jgi:peptidoglycan/LPS O-acetylase OafA/YrhL
MPRNPPSWSISAEFWMHVLFAFICRTANGFSSYNATLLILVSIPLLAIDADRYLTISSSNSAIARCVFGFSFGALSFNLWTSGVGETLRRCNSYLIATVSEAILTFACVALVSWSAMGPLSMLCPALFALTVFVFAAERGPISVLLLTKPLMFLGLLSYSIYMVHEFMIARFINVVQLVSKYLAMPFMPHPTHSFEIINAPGWTHGVELATVLILISVIATSHITYKYIESPFREWSRRIVRRGGLFLLSGGFG